MTREPLRDSPTAQGAAECGVLTREGRFVRRKVSCSKRSMLPSLHTPAFCMGRLAWLHTECKVRICCKTRKLILSILTTTKKQKPRELGSLQRAQEGFTDSIGSKRARMEREQALGSGDLHLGTYVDYVRVLTGLLGRS